MSRRMPNYREWDDDDDGEKDNEWISSPLKKKKKEGKCADDDNGSLQQQLVRLREKYETLHRLRYTEAEKNLKELVTSSGAALAMEKEKRRMIEEELVKMRKRGINDVNIEDDGPERVSFPVSDDIKPAVYKELYDLRETNHKLKGDIEKKSDLLMVYKEITGLQVSLPHSSSSTLEKSRVPAVIECKSVSHPRRVAKFTLHREEKYDDQSKTSYRFAPTGDTRVFPEELRDSIMILSEEVPLIVSKITENIFSNQ
jgi:hypothetical protein